MTDPTAYHAAIDEDARAFDGATLIYRNDLIRVLDADRQLPSIGTPWPTRPLSAIEGLCVHHKGGWASYVRTNTFVRTHRPRPYARLAYHLGVHHAPPRDPTGRVTVYLLNPLTATTWASGAPRASASPWWRHQTPARQKDANAWTVALNLNGFFASTPYYPEGRTPDGQLVTQPSTHQLRALLGVVLMLEDLCPRFSRKWVFGHHDVGKVACPGDTTMGFVRAIREDAITGRADLEARIGAMALPDGYPTATASGVDVRRAQQLLVQLGYHLGATGPKGDGVDGIWGPKSIKALLDFEGSHGHLGCVDNGHLDPVDLAAMEQALAHPTSSTP